MTTLNAAFEWKLALEDKGYKSGSENFNMPTSLRKMPKIHHTSSIENPSFVPDPVTPCSTVQSHLRPVHRQLKYNSSNNSDTSEEETLTALRATPDAQVYLEEDEEGFQMVPLDDEHWTTEEASDRFYAYMNMPYHMYCACIHALMQTAYLLTFSNTMDLSDISNFEDIMIMSSDEDIPALADAPY